MIFQTIAGPLVLLACLNDFSSGTCITKQGKACVFPFRTRGVTYTKCTYDGGFSTPWCTTKAPNPTGCPAGFVEDPGDVYGGGIRGPFKSSSITECGTACQQESTCNSFNYSPTKSLCVIYANKQPNGPVYNDFRFCKKPQDTDPSPKQCCGIKGPDPKIVGGTDATMNEYPWIAHLLVTYAGDGSYNCGGSLIASQWILTAEHCTTPKDGKLPTVRVTLGDHRRSVYGETSKEKEMVSASIYNYGGGLSTDIALIKLRDPVDLRTYMPICLPKSGAQYTGQKAWVYGWGTTSYGGSTADTLQETQIDVISNAACDSAFSNNGINMANMQSSQVCAGANGEDSCQGDSGGPLSVDNNGHHEQVGIVSFGIGCASPGLYGVYSNVAYFRDWIDKTMNDNGGAQFCM